MVGEISQMLRRLSSLMILGWIGLAGQPAFPQRACFGEASNVTVQVQQGQVIATYAGTSGFGLRTDSASDTGGARVDRAYLELIFWGGEWQTAVNPSRNDVVAAIQNILQGPYLSQLSQYGFLSLTLGAVTSIASDPPKTLSSGDVGAALWNLIQNKQLPAPDTYL